jgi:hypothetical protein
MSAVTSVSAWSSSVPRSSASPYSQSVTSIGHLVATYWPAAVQDQQSSPARVQMTAHDSPRSYELLYSLLYPPSAAPDWRLGTPLRWCCCDAR